MRIDVVSIFPEYLAPLDLSLIGKARVEGIVDIEVHDLRDWTHDRHRTVDDTPYGGGAGMVMSPAPWGEAIDALIDAARQGGAPRLVVPTPSGRRFTQRDAQRLAAEPWLVFACGRYEGIDQRVVDHYGTRIAVDEVSLGDYVLGGGEAAALVMIEAITRLLPGMVGNPESLAEESHGDDGFANLLEYPVYTKPPSWRGLDVPDVLLSGNHGAIAAWRHEQAIRRTAERRPDLLHAGATFAAGDLDDASLAVATSGDAPELLVLQRCCWVSEAQLNNALTIPPLNESAGDVARDLDEWLTFVVRVAGRLVGSVRGRLEGSTWEIGRLMVAPDMEGRGLGRWLLEYVEHAAPAEATHFALFTGALSGRNLRMYRRAGYRLVGGEPPIPGAVKLVKPKRA